MTRTNLAMGLALVVAAAAAASAVLLVLRAGAPKDLDEWLAREAAALRAADADDLTPGLQRIREAIIAEGDDALLGALWKESHRARLERIDQELGPQFADSLIPTAMPEGANGWEHLLEANALAESVEALHGRPAFEGDGAPGATHDELRAACEELPVLLRAALDCPHIARPDYGVRAVSEEVKFVGTAFCRVAVTRVRGLLAAGEGQQAFEEAQLLLSVLAHTQFGMTLIDQLTYIVCCGIVCERLVLLPGWNAEQTEALAGLMVPRRAQMAELMFTEAVVQRLECESASKRRFEPGLFETPYRLTLTQSLTDMGWPTIDKHLELEVDVGYLRQWLRTARWLKANPTNFHDPIQAGRALDEIGDDTRRTWLSTEANWLEVDATRMAAMVRAAELRAPETTDGLKLAQEIASRTGVLLARAASGGGIEFCIDPTHPLNADAAKARVMYTLKPR